MEKAELERELICRFTKARDEKKRLTKEKTEAEKEFDAAAKAVAEYLENIDATATARYDSIGYLKAEKPKPYATVSEEIREPFLEFVRRIGREDVIKESIHPSTLSTFIKECLETGIALPEFLTVYFKPQIRLYGRASGDGE